MSGKELEEKEENIYMKKVVNVESREEHYTADAWCVECIDDRFRGALDELKQVEGWEHFDRTQWAGGAKEIAAGNTALLDQLSKSLKLHNTKEVALTVHQSCGAYGDAMPKDVGEAMKFMDLELRKAAEVVRTHLEQEGRKIPIKMFIVAFDGIYELA
jgi:hypothetical protein